MKYEYAVRDIETTDRDDLQFLLNKAGAEGWDLVQSYPHRYQNNEGGAWTTVTRWVFKRPVP